MRLEQTILMQRRLEVSVSGSLQSAEQIAKMIFDRVAAEGRMLASSPDEWQRKRLTSHQFILLSVPLNRVAAPNGSERIYASSITNEPIIVDMNRAKAGYTFGGMGPGVIVIEGVERFHAAAERGESRIPAWVGVKAAKKLNLIHADHEMSSQEICDQLSVLISKRYPNGSSTSNKISSVPYIVQLYPYELYSIYCYEGKNYRQKFIIAPDRSVALDGPATEVIAKFVDNVLASRDLLRDLQACACALAAESTVQDNNMAYVHGKKKTVKVGGPGSGPHKSVERIAKETGREPWSITQRAPTTKGTAKQFGYKPVGSGEYTHNSGHSIRVHSNNSATVYHVSGPSKEVANAEQLREHLKVLHPGND